jgi:hypothetical protein
MKNIKSIEMVVKIFYRMFEIFKKSVKEEVLSKMMYYLENGMFIRAIPYEEEREIIRFLPFM